MCMLPLLVKSNVNRMPPSFHCTLMNDNRNGPSPMEVNRLTIGSQQEEIIDAAGIGARRREEARAERRKRSDEKLCTASAAWSKRCRRRGRCARPDSDRLTKVSVGT